MIQILAQYWWAFLALTIVFYGLIVFNQINRMKRMTSLSAYESDNPFGGFFKGVGFLAVYAIAGTVSGIGFIIGAIVAIINAVK